MILRSEQQQLKTGARLLRCLPATGLVYLEGDLGSGKTTLIRGLLRAAGVSGVIRSPTYSLCELYEVEGRQFAHLDLYRLGDVEELEYLGLRDWLATHLLLIEWPAIARAWLGAPQLEIRLQQHPQGRELEFSVESNQSALKQCLSILDQDSR